MPLVEKRNWRQTEAGNGSWSLESANNAGRDYDDVCAGLGGEKIFVTGGRHQGAGDGARPSTMIGHNQILIDPLLPLSGRQDLVQLCRGGMRLGLERLLVPWKYRPVVNGQWDVSKLPMLRSRWEVEEGCFVTTDSVA